MRIMLERSKKGTLRILLALSATAQLAALVAGCSVVDPMDPPNAGDLPRPILCVGNSRVTAGEPLPLDEERFLSFAGEITSVREYEPGESWGIIGCAPSTEAPSLVLEVTDDDGTAWKLGLGLQHGTTFADETPPLDLHTGQRVNTQLHGVSEPSGNRAIAISDESGLILAFEWPTGNKLNGRTDGLEVVHGASYTPRLEETCGTVQYTRVRFNASDTLELAPPEQGTIHMGEQPLRAMALLSTLVHRPRCSHASDTLGWMVWRAPPSGS